VIVRKRWIGPLFVRFTRHPQIGYRALFVKVGWWTIEREWFQ